MKKIIALLACIQTLSAGPIPPGLLGLSYGVYPDDVQYNSERFNYNQRYNFFPQAILSPTTEIEAQTVLGILTNPALNNYDQSFSVRGGGHCYEPGSLSSSTIFSLSGFSGTLSYTYPTATTAKIGAGNLLGTVDGVPGVIDTLGPLGYAIPTGTCTSVGVAGLTLGGGIGLLGRPYGLTVDYVKSFTLLTADNNIIEVDANNYPDLFYALRGGGNGAYGIVLYITYNLLQVPDTCYYQLIFPWNPETAPEIFEAMQNWVATLPDNISVITTTAYDYGQTSLIIEGLKVGSTALVNPFTEWQSAFGAFNPEVDLKYDTYYGTSQYWVAQDNSPFRKAISNVLMTPISNKGIKKIFNFINHLSEIGAQTEFIFQVEALGGKIAQSTSPIMLKNGFAWMYQPTIWKLQSEEAAALDISSKFHSYVSKYVSKFAMNNTVDYTLGNYFLTAYFGSNAAQLIEIKKKYDPNNVFKWQQSIPESGPVAGTLICQ